MKVGESNLRPCHPIEHESVDSRAANLYSKAVGTQVDGSVVTDTEMDELQEGPNSANVQVSSQDYGFSSLCWFGTKSSATKSSQGCGKSNRSGMGDDGFVVVYRWKKKIGIRFQNKKQKPLLVKSTILGTRKTKGFDFSRAVNGSSKPVPIPVMQCQQPRGTAATLSPAGPTSGSNQAGPLPIQSTGSRPKLPCLNSKSSVQSPNQVKAMGLDYYYCIEDVDSGDDNGTAQFFATQMKVGMPKVPLPTAPIRPNDL
ncbi:hypothetical protein L1987_01186 [Smallanthus sonchifolius]|uniref:Uncharacterized protein n=1 Tax=Smallanthus sonchifolius TaxID=185202 RepID=A0ACB9K4D4_9ASTR|nr:hypothetical protein L1987_01186 [Smallanthus sonchifolius]